MAAQSSRMHLKQKVETPYGVGKIIEIRSGHYVVEPETWRLAAGQKPTFYMNPKDVKPFFKIGDSVRSVFGIGQVKDIRGENNTYVVTLNNWKLADGKSPTLYLNDDSMTREGPSAADLEQKAVEAKIEGVLSKVAQMREIAKDLYAQKKFEEAKAKYTEIMESLRVSLGHAWRCANRPG